MTHRDLFYDIASPETAINFLPQYGFYQSTHQKNSKWLPFSSHDLQKRMVLKHSGLSFHEPFPTEGYSDTWANQQIRFGSFYVDFDDKNNLQKAIQEAQQFVQNLLDKGVDARGIHAFASGSKGAYILIDSRLLGPASLAGHVNLGNIHKILAQKLLSSFSTVDYSVYVAQKKGRLIRTANSKRDNGNFRAKIDTVSFARMPSEEVVSAMSSPGQKIEYPYDLTENPFLTQLFNEALNSFTSTSSSIKNHFKNASSPSTEEETDSRLETPKCIKDFNNSTFLHGDPSFRFNDWAFRAASLVSNRPEDEAVSILSTFLEQAPSQTYSTYDSKVGKFKEQLRDVKNKGTKTPYCDSIRKALKQAPCEQCSFFEKHISDVGQSFFLNSRGTFRIRIDDQKNVHHDPISNAVAMLERLVHTYDLTNTRINLTYEYRIYVGKKSFLIKISNDDLNNNDKLTNSLTLHTGGLILFNTRERKPAVTLLQVGRAEGPLKDQRILYSKMGFTQNLCFVFRNAIIENGKAIFFDEPIIDGRENSKQACYTWEKISISDASERLKNFLKDLLKIHTLDVVLPTLAYSISLPIFHLVEYQQRFYLMLRGLTGDSKTTMALASLSLWGNFSGKDSFISAASTTNTVEAEASQLGEVLFLIDDVKMAHTNINEFKRIPQNYADGVARGRLRSDASIMSGYVISGLMLLTGEDGLGASESSTAGRGFEIPIEKATKNLDAFMQLQKSSKLMTGILPLFFAFLQKQESSKMKDEFHEAIKKFSSKIISGENKERICSNLAILDISFKYFLLWAQQELKWTAETINFYQQAQDLALVKIGIHQASSAADATCANLFLDELKSLLGSEKARLKTPTYHGEIPTFDRGTIVGELFTDHEVTDHVHVIPKVAFQLVKESLEKQGVSFAFSIKAVAQALDRLGHFQEKDQDKNTKRRRSNRTGSNENLGTNLDYWVFKKDLLGVDTTKDFAHLAKPTLVKE